jgi:hypothetical protein
MRFSLRSSSHVPVCGGEGKKGLAQWRVGPHVLLSANLDLGTFVFEGTAGVETFFLKKN